MKLLIVGIDPGANGGIALIDEKGTCIKSQRTPVNKVVKSGKVRNELDAAAAFGMLRHYQALATEMDARFVICIERVLAFFMDGVISSFSLGRNIGIWEGIITSLEVPHHSIPPQVWKKAIINKTVPVPKSAVANSKKPVAEGETVSEAKAERAIVSKQRTKLAYMRKLLAIEAAKRLFPLALVGVKKKELDGIAEALLIAEWGRRQELGILKESQPQDIDITSPDVTGTLDINNPAKPEESDGA